MRIVTLLTKSDCMLCEDAKAALDELRGEFALEIETVDLASERGQRLALEAGIVFAPGVLIDGRPFSHGRLPRRKLRRELEGRRAVPG